MFDGEFVKNIQYLGLPYRLIEDRIPVTMSRKQQRVSYINRSEPAFIAEMKRKAGLNYQEPTIESKVFIECPFEMVSHKILSDNRRNEKIL